MLRRLGFIGAGRMAREHARAATAMGAQVDVVLVPDTGSPNVVEFQKVVPGPRFVSNAKAFWESDMEAIVVVAPWHVIPNMMAELFEDDRPMLIEKPIILGRKAAWDAANRNTENKIIGFNRRFYGAVNRLKSAVQANSLKSVEITICEAISSIVQRHGEEIIPHIPEMYSAHILDLMFYLFGDLEMRFCSTYREKEIDFVSSDAMFVTTAGVPLHLTLNANDPSPVGIRARFDDGTTYGLSPIEMLTIYKGVEVAEATEDSPIRRYTGRELSRHCEEGQFKPGFYEQMTAFLHGETKQAAGVGDAVRVHNLIWALKDGECSPLS